MKRLSHPLDRVALTVIAILAILIGILVVGGDHTTPLVRGFNWQDKSVGIEDKAFTLTFNRAMDWPSVKEHLQITPNLSGKLSWAGRRLAYTLTQPIPYGTQFQVKLTHVQEARRTPNDRTKVMQPFSGQFRSRDRAYCYLGVNGEEAGRLILNNLTQKQKNILTPADWVVLEFQPYPYGDRLLFSATPRDSEAQGNFNPQLYTVTTGLAVNPPEMDSPPPQQAGQIELVLDNKTYQILKFDLAPDGSRIVLQRAPREGSGLGEVSLWQLPTGGSPQPLEKVQGGDFLIAPDGRSLVIAQGQGLAIVPLDGTATDQPLEFLPKFGMVLSFARDGSAATMLKFNPNFTRSLFLVTNQGEQTELLKTTGSILSAVFDPNQQLLYCLLTQVGAGKEYVETPYLATIDLKTKTETRLLDLPNQRDMSMALAPDGSALLFDQAIEAKTENPGVMRTKQGSAIATSNLWLLPLQSTDGQPRQPQGIGSGLDPQWLP
ncbi:MAG: Ig-like domain-containing protein [Acaryochloris sp. SU_5_25]|nr:Ig-like domain-containing protein [Acaryochloris sp. SU_5_25]